VANIEVAARKISGTLIAPGEEFSFVKKELADACCNVIGPIRHRVHDHHGDLY
jgi:hypothetical protein